MQVCINQIDDYYSSNFTEDEPLWQPKPVLYNSGDIVREGHYLYKYAGQNNTNTDESPVSNIENAFEETVWVLDRASNYYSALGNTNKDETGDQTEVTGDMVFEINVQNYDVISLLNIYGTDVTIELTDLTTMQTITYNIPLLSDENINDWYDYFFVDLDYKTSLYLRMGIVYNGRVRVTISNRDGVSKLGRLICGQSEDLGVTLIGSNFDLNNYSSIDFDLFGKATILKRPATFDSNHEVLIPTGNIPILEEKIKKKYNALPLLFIADPSENSKVQNLLTYGLLNSASISFSSPVRSRLNLNIKELI